MIFSGVTSPGYYRYGDECLNGRVSLLHFCVFFLLAGTIVITVGLVQYKEDAELFKYRQTIVIIGCISMGVGMLNRGPTQLDFLEIVSRQLVVNFC